MATSVNQGLVGNVYIDGLLVGTKWAGQINFSFPQNVNQYQQPYASDLDGTPILNGYQGAIVLQHAEAVRAILGGYTLAADNMIKATSVASFIAPAVVESGLNGSGDIRYGVSNVVGNEQPPARVADFPNNSPDGSGGDVWFNPDVHNWSEPPTTGWAAGTYEYVTTIHESGHALGLKHPHNQIGTFPLLPSDRDGMEFSVMSYRDYVGDAVDGLQTTPGNVPQTFMQLDILALQTMYGADYGAGSNPTNTTYSWDPITGQMFINGVGQGRPTANKVFLTIWDGGGVDTYNMSNYNEALSIDLTPGGWSKTSNTQLAQLEDGRQANGTVYNSFLFNGDVRSIIENAIGGGSADLIVGNQVANVLMGITGADLISGGAGNDILDGGDGTDTLIGGLGNDTYVLANGTDTVNETSGIDTITSTIARSLISYPTIENLTLLGTSAISGIGNALNNVITGNAAANTLNGGNGNDSLNGGLGLDSLIGGLGNDTFVLVNGTDTVNDAGGIDTITSTITRSLAAYPAIENLTLLGAAAINGTGNALNNILTGNTAANILNGGFGFDTLIGGLGKDTLTGSGNGDRFDFNALAESVVGANRDLIQDFNRVQGDKIDLSTIDADTDGTAGNQAFSFIGAGAFNGVDGQLRCSAGIIQGDVNGDKVADFEIKVNLATMISSDFIF